MRLVLLLGSGASVGAGMPTVDAITEQVLSGENVFCSGGDFRLVDALPAHNEMSDQRLGPVLDFVRDIKWLCDDYFASQDKDRATNYEDIAYAACPLPRHGVGAVRQDPPLRAKSPLLRPGSGRPVRLLRGPRPSSQRARPRRCPRAGDCADQGAPSGDPGD